MQAAREGETGIVRIGAAISNLKGSACSLPVVPVRVDLVPRSAKPLALQVEPPLGDPSTRITIQPHVTDGADLIAYWMNWCGVDVGLLEIRVTFDAGNAAVIAPLGGSLLARCDNPKHPSSIQIDSVTASSP
jgi:hypothetical protein